MSDTSLDLGDFSNVPLSAVETDADGNTLTGEPPVWSSSDEAVITLTDNGDGTVTAVRVAASGGTAVVSATVTNPDGSQASGTITLSLADTTPPPPNVVDVAIVAGEPS